VHPRGRRLLVAVTLAASLLIAAAPRAGAHDSLAPGGAQHTWLPAEDWVHMHWIPFDEQRLKRALGLRGRGLEAYLYNDHRALADLARARGLALAGLVEHLLAPWGPAVEPARMAVLRDRTTRILTQPHLAQHVFFHVFHGTGIEPQSLALFGMTRPEFQRRRALGETPLEIAAARGIAEPAVVAGITAMLHHHHERGLALGVASPLQSRRIVARQLARLGCWLRRPKPPLDRANPYGKGLRQHGPHAAGWPATPAQRRADDARVERVRRSLPPSCWSPPPAWAA